MTDDDQIRARLSPEPYSLAPPPGVLEQVTRGARRRRMGRMTAAVLSTVVAAAGVAGASSVVASRLLDNDRKAPPGARGTSPAPTPSISNSARATPTATPSAVTLPTAPPRVRPDDGTDVQDLTWISTETGWALGFVLDCAHVGGDKAVPACYTILHTVDGGQTWDKISTIPDTGTGIGGVQLRFASKTVGYLTLRGSLSMSTDGGRTWTASKLKGVIAVEAARTGATALVNESPGEARCSPCHVMHAALGSRVWKKTLELRYDAADLRRSGETVLAATFANPAGGADDKSAKVHVSRDGGLTWARAGDPCAAVHIGGHYVPYAMGFELAGDVVLASCRALDYGNEDHDFVILSTDGGATYGDWHDTPCSYGRFALGGVQMLACPAQDGVHVSNDGGATWELRLPAGGRAGADGCGFQTETVGRCARGVTVYTTRDAGHTWKARDVSAS